MIDTHCHLQFPEYSSDLDLVIKRMIDSEVSEAIVVGTDVESSLSATRLAEEYPHLYASVGIHPTEVNQGKFDGDIKLIKSLVSHQKVVAIGEVGLDYKVFNDVEPNRKLQAECLVKLIELANKSNLPVIIHSRLADDDLINLLKLNKPTSGGVIHCFDSEYEMASSALDLGLHISFTGMLTYPKKDSLRGVASRLPHDRVLLETDCPYLPPQSKRGERNEPANMVETAAVLASLWKRDLGYVDKVTSQNARDLFRI